MRKFYTLLLLVFLSTQVFAQKNAEQTYEAENIGYFITPVETPYGIIFTDNYASKIYLFKNGKVKTLVESAGCGRYFSVSVNGKYISYKSINENGKQAAAYFDLENKKSVIADYSDKCSQITIETNITKQQLYELSHLKSQTANITPFSPDGKSMVYDSEQSFLKLVNLEKGEEKELRYYGNGVIYPKWSPDGKKILFQNKKGSLIVYDIIENCFYTIGKGGSGNWDANSENIVYQQTVSDVHKFELKSSEIFISHYKGHNANKFRLTNTPDIYEMNPSFDLKGGILYQTYDKRQIVRAKLNSSKSAITSTKILLDNPKNIKPKFYNTAKFSQTKSITHLTKNVPYIHQKYDAPTGSNGGSACAPTTSNMALAYYNRLPKWPIPANNYTSVTGTNHTNDYSGYVLAKYKYNEHYFDAYSSSKNSWGGYAYMWIDPYSSPGGGDGMRNYQNHHDMTSGSYVWLSNATFQKTCDEIDNEYPHPICSWITHSGHLTLAVGYVNGQHTIIFNDPWGNKNTAGYPSYDGADSYYDWPGYNNGYQNLDPDGSHGKVAWTLTARSSEPVYDDLRIDNTSYNHGFHINNSEDGAKQSYYRHVEDAAGSNGHIWWTGGEGGAASDICWASWTPNLPTAATYKVEVYIPAVFTDTYSAAAVTSSAYYKIYYDGGNTSIFVNQLANQGSWVDLGNYQFPQGQVGYVRVGDAVDVADGSKKILFDAVRFTEIAGNMVVSSTNITCTGANDGTASVTSVPCANPTYLWTPGGQTIASISGLSAGNYTVDVTDDCSTYQANITIEEAAQLLAVTTSDTDPSSFGASDGQIIANVTGGVEPYTYVWSPNVSTTNLAQNLPAGTYQVTVTDAYGCEKIASTTLIDPVCTSCCVLLQEDFSGQTQPSGWQNTDNSGSNSDFIWRFNNPKPRSIPASNFDADFAILDADYIYANIANGSADAIFQTPAINCTGRTDVRLEFDQYFIMSSSHPADAVVEISNDGSTWTQLGATLNTVTVGPEFLEYDISVYASNQATVYVRWVYTDRTAYSNYWAIDNIEIYAPPAGTKTISANGGDYLNFTEAINAINNCGVGTGGVTFLVSDDEIFTEDPPIITATGDVTKPVVFIKDGSGANPIIKPTGTASTTNAGIALAGGDYFTFDGVDIQIASGSALEFGYYLYNISDTDGSQHNTFKNCSVTLNKSNTNSVGINQLVQTSINPTTADGANSFNVYQNITIQNSYYGMNLFGYDVSGNEPLYDDACEVSNCNISDFGGSNLRAAGIIAWSQKNTNYFENTIYSGSTTLRTYGIYLAEYSSGNIYKNRIYDIYGTDSQVAGIRTYEADCNIYLNEVSDIEGIKMSVGIEAFGGTSSVYNNFVYDIKSPSGNSTANGYPSTRGISFRSTSGTQSVFYNTVYLAYTSTNSGNESTCLFIDNAVADLRNNIFENNSLASTGTRAVVLYFGDNADITGLSANSDNNLYYNGSAITKYALAYEKSGGTSYLNLAAYQTPSPNDANSIEENPPFKSTVLPYNMHLAPTQASNIDGGGTPIAGITTDFDNENRDAVTPDIGADEYDTGGPLCGTTYTIDNTLATSGLNYNNFTDAINDLNDRGISCAVVFNVHDNQTFVEDVPVLDITGTVANTIIFQKSGAGANPILQPTGTTDDDDYGIHINGGDYFTFDGIDVSISGGSEVEYGFYITTVSATDGSQNNTIKNCTITLNNSNVNSVGIYQFVRTNITPTNATGANSYNIYDNVTVENAYFGMKIYGYDVTGQEALYDDATEIKNCTVNNFGHTGVEERAVGIHTWSQKNLDIHHNTVTNGTTDLRTLGIYTAGNNQGNVYNNLVHGLYGTDSQVVGLRAYESDVDFYNNETYDIEGVDMASGIEIFGGTANIYNNFVRDIRTPGTDTYNYPTTRGISHRKGTTNIFNNSILLNFTSTAETNESAGIFIEGFYGATATSDIRNNIVVNKTDVSTGGFAVALYKSAEYSTVETTSDNNLYYSGTPSAKNLIYYDTNVSDQTLADYQTRTSTYELNSITEDAPYISTTNLHILTSAITYIDGGGQVLGTVTTDFDADARDATVPDIGADEYECDFIVWHGTTDTDWATATNWQKQQVPTSADNAIIPDVSLKSNNFPIITSAGETNNLTIYSGANLQINPDFSLSVNGIMDNQAGNTGLLIKSDATGTGSFINTTASISATVERYFEGTQWHYLTSPTIDAPLTMFNTNNFYFYDETIEDSWGGGLFTGTMNMGWTTVINPNLTSFEGYAYYFTEITLNFTGDLHTGTYTSPALSWTNTAVSDEYEGWHLLGNPYPSAIDFSAANVTATNINLTDVEPSVYFYDDIAHNYKGYNTSSGGINGGTQYIPAMQGFFVHATQNNATFEVENGARVHNTTNFYKSNKTSKRLQDLRASKTDNQFITLQTSANSFTDETKIIENTEANFTFDSNFDLYKMYSREENVAQIWSINESVEFALNAVPYFNDNQIIPLGFRGYNSDIYEINLSEINLSSDIYLIDNLLETYQNLTENPVYNFSHENGADLIRFEIHFTQPTNIDAVSENHILIYPNPTSGIVNINLTGLEDLSGLSLQITDVSGKIIKQLLVNSKELSVDLSEFESGVYFLRIQTENSIFVEKIIVE